MGNAAGSPVPVPAISNQMINQKSTSECPMKNTTTVTDSPSKVLPASSQAPKCPISGQESKEGKTCAYDPTKMSFWQTKALAQMVQKPFVTDVTSPEVTAIETGGCPVKKSTMPIVKEEGCPMKVKANTIESKEEKSSSAFVKVYKNPTQYNVYSQKIDPTNQMPSAANQLPAPNQSGTLDTQRVTSTIPKAGSDDGAWVYPSPQMFWNALVRKGKTDGASEEDMDTVIAVHNNMNETTWRQVIAWEALNGTPKGADKAPKLLRFMGRPDELSPMARMKMLFSHPAPFDRHDWTVDRGGKEVRYIIDYYHDESAVEMDQRPQHLKDITSMQSIKVDVRPALDSVDAFYARLVEMPLAMLQQKTVYNPPTFFPSDQMKSAGENKNDRIANNWVDIKTKCATAKDNLAACDSEESCGAASVALQRCVSSVVCPSVTDAFDACVSAVPHDDTKTGAAFTSMIKCIELFEMDTKQLQQQKQLQGAK